MFRGGGISCEKKGFYFFGFVAKLYGHDGLNIIFVCLEMFVRVGIVWTDVCETYINNFRDKEIKESKY